MLLSTECIAKLQWNITILFQAKIFIYKFSMSLQFDQNKILAYHKVPGVMNFKLVFCCCGFVLIRNMQKISCSMSRTRKAVSIYKHFQHISMSSQRRNNKFHNLGSPPNAAVICPKYCRYRVKHYIINQSFLQMLDFKKWLRDTKSKMFYC